MSGGREGLYVYAHAHAYAMYMLLREMRVLFWSWLLCVRGISVFGDYSERRGRRRRGEAGVRDHNSVVDFYGRNP